MSTETNSSSTTACPVHHAALPEKPFISQGEVHFAAHQVGWIVCGFFTIISVAVSAWLINKHLSNYTNKGQQRYIVRCLFLVPIYATISTLSYILYDSYASPLIIFRDCYEAVVLHAFFYLLLEYVSHDEEEQKEAFREIKLDKWMFPLGWIRRKPSGLYFLQIMKWGVLQYAVLRPTCTLASLILNWVGLYCEDSWSPVWGHIYLVTIISISVSVAMYCLLQLYMPISDILKPHKPILKFLSVKAVVFLTFWQSTFLAVLASFGVVKDTPYMTAEEINIGFGALLETFEMVIFAFVHLRAFTYQPYRPKPEDRAKFTPTPRLRSLGHVLDFRDIFRQIWKGCVYMWDRMRGYEPDTNERYSHFQKALGTRRIRGSGDKEAMESDRLNLDDPYDRKIPPQRDHPWLKLDSQTTPWEPNQDVYDGGFNADHRHFLAMSEYEKRQQLRREERRDRRKRKSGSSSHQRDAAAVEKYDHLPTGGPDIFTRLDEQDSDTFPKRPGGQRAAQGQQPFWRGWYDRMSNGGNGWGHSAVPQADEDDWDHHDRSPTRLIRKQDVIQAPVPRSIPRIETGMVVLSRPPKPDSPPPPPPPKDPRLLSPTSPQSRPAGPIRADSFMNRVFTAEVASSDDHAPSRSSMNVQELVGPLSGPWIPDSITERTESPVERVVMKNVGGRQPQPPPARNSLVTGLPATNMTMMPVQVPSPKQSQQGSVYGGSAEGSASLASSSSRHRGQPQAYPQYQPQGVQRVQSRGPRRPADIVLPSPLSPARYPGIASPPISPTNPAPPRLPPGTQPLVGSGSRYPVFIPSPPAARRASLVGESPRSVRPRVSSQEMAPGSSRPGGRSSIDGDNAARRFAPLQSNQSPPRGPSNAYQAVDFPISQNYPQTASRSTPQASWPQGVSPTGASSGLTPIRTTDNIPRPPPGAQIPHSLHVMTRDPVNSFSPTDGQW